MVEAGIPCLVAMACEPRSVDPPRAPDFHRSWSGVGFEDGSEFSTEYPEDGEVGSGYGPGFVDGAWPEDGYDEGADLRSEYGRGYGDWFWTGLGAGDGAGEYDA